MTYTEDFSKPHGLPGLRAIRDILGITAQDLSNMVGVSTNWVSVIERGHDDCTDKLKRQIAGALRCKVVDLIEPADEARLAEIKANFFQARADEARAAADRAKGAA